MKEPFLIITYLIGILGIILIQLSNPGRIISKMELLEIITNKPSYSIKDIRKVISLCSNDLLIKKLERKILYRKIGFTLLLIFPFFILSNGFF